jgi:hypothetical protein
MDIVKETKDKKKKTWYLFSYHTKKSKWIIEEEANRYPALINEYLQAKNLKESSISDECKVEKEKNCLNKKKTRGLFTLMFSCGFLLNFKELLFSEGLVNVCTFINETCNILGNSFDYIVYDNGCKMHAHIKNNPTVYSNLARTVCLIDRFHIKNHQATCFKHFNPDDVKVMNGLNTQACEECNFDINRFKFQTRHMTEYSYQLFWLNYFNFKNTNNYNP